MYTICLQMKHVKDGESDITCCKLELKLDIQNLQTTSKPRLLNLIVLNLIGRWPTERSHYINNLWNATFGLWKIRIMNGWMVSFEWKQANITKTGNLSQLCDFVIRVSVGNYFFPSVSILRILWRSYCEKISMTEFIH